MRRRPMLAVGLLLALGPSAGCLMPEGPPVIVEQRAISSWSGNGVLLETSDDGTRCRVAVRGRALVVERRWVRCSAVHPRSRGR